MADFNIELGFDDSELFKGLNRTAQGLDNVDKEAKQLNNTLDKTAKQTSNNFKQVERSVEDAGKAIDKTTARSRRLSSQFRSFQRDISLIRNFALGGIFTSAAAGLQTFAKGLETAAGFLSASVGINQRFAASVGNVASKFVEEKSSLDSLFVSARSDNENKQERKAAVDAILDQYGPYLSDVEREQLLLGDVAAAQEAATRALIDNLAAQAKRQQLTNIINEFAQAESARAAQQAEAESTIGQVADLASGLFGNVVSFVSAGQVEIDTRLSAVNEAITDAQQESLLAQAKQIQTVEDRTKEFLTNLNQELNDSFNDTANAQNEAANKLIEQQKKQAERRAKEAQREAEKLAKAQEQFNRDALSKAAARDSILLELQRQTADARLEILEDGEKQAIEKQNTAFERRKADLQAQQQQVIDELSDQQDRVNELFGAGSERASRFALEAAAERLEIEKQTAALIEAETLVNARKLEDIRKEFDEAEKERQEQAAQERLDAAIETDNQTIALEEARLRKKQALELAGLNSEQATEDQRNELLEQQARERERLTLESERRRLETVLRFTEGRTEAEIEATKTLLAAVNQELNNFDAARDSALEPDEGQTILGALGFTDKEQDAINQGISQAVGGLENLLEQQVELAAAAVEAKNQQIAELRTQLNEELALNEAGFASNVEGVRQQLEEEEKAREIALEKQRKAQQAQVALQTIQQSVNLITASTQIFSSLAGAGPVGIGIAIATIAAMFGAFVAAKAKAASLTKLAEGGILEGPSHNEGGIPVSIGGRAPTYEAEGGEFVTNKRDTKEHKRFLERLNKGEFRGIDLEAMATGAERVRRLGYTVDRANKAERRKTEQLTFYAIAASISTQTDQLLKNGFGKLLSKPQTTIIDKETLFEVKHDSKGGRIVKQINLKK